MLVRYLPLILVLGALAPTRSVAQEFYLGAGHPTQGTPSDREAANGVFDHKRKPTQPGQTPKIELGEVQAAPPHIQGVRPEDVAARYVPQAEPYTTDPPPKTAAPKTAAEPNPADKQARPKAEGAPVNSSSANKALPPGTDARQVRPAEAFPPERIDKTPQAPDRAGIDTPSVPFKETPKDDPRSVEENKDPGG